MGCTEKDESIVVWLTARIFPKGWVTFLVKDEHGFIAGPNCDSVILQGD